MSALDLDDRYGRKRSRSRFFGYLIYLILALISLIWLIWSGSYHSNPVVDPNLISFHAIDDKNMGITFEITRRDPKQAITCRLTAVDIDKYFVGEVQYRIPPTTKSRNQGSDKHLVITTKISTRSRAVSASVVSCSPTD